MVKVPRTVISTLTLLLLITSCGPPYDKAKTKRQQKAEQNQGDLIIAVVWPDLGSPFVKGAQLAAKEINNNGGVLTRSVKILLNSEERGAKDNVFVPKKDQLIGMDIAKSIANNPEVIAVIGHHDSALSIAASVVYEQYGIIFLAQTAPNLSLTTHHSKYIFRMIPDNKTIGQQLAEFSHRAGYKSMVIAQERDQSKKEILASFLSTVAEKYDINIVFRRSFFSSNVDMIKLIQDLIKIGDFDAILALTSSPVAMKLYERVQIMGLKTPFLGGPKLNENHFWDVVESSKDLIGFAEASVPTVFNPYSRATQPFVDSYKYTYQGEFPTYLAALAYDAVNLIAFATNLSGSASPNKIAKTLHYMPPCVGVAGFYKFGINGEIANTPRYFKTMQNGGFSYQRTKKAKASIATPSSVSHQFNPKAYCSPYNPKAILDASLAADFPCNEVQPGLFPGCPLKNPYP